jgi:hypothetical protein
MTRWHVFDRAHQGFWDDPEGQSGTATASASVPIGPSSQRARQMLFDSTLTNPAAVSSTYTYPVLLDSVLSASIAATTSTVTLNTGLDGVLNVLIHFTTPLTFDGYLTPLVPVTPAVSLDASLLFSALTRTTTSNYDSLLLSAASTLQFKSAFLDALIGNSQCGKLGFDAILSGNTLTTLTKTTGFDSTFLTTNSRNLLFDSLILRTVQSTQIQRLDTILMRQVTASHLMDSVLVKAIGFNSQIGFDAVLQSSPHPLVNLDALLQLTIPATGADSVLVDEVTSGTRLTKTTSLDAVLQLTVPAAGSDAVLT